VVKNEIDILNTARYLSVVSVMLLVDKNGTNYKFGHFAIGSKLTATKGRKLETVDPFSSQKSMSIYKKAWVKCGASFRLSTSAASSASISPKIHTRHSGTGFVDEIKLRELQFWEKIAQGVDNHCESGSALLYVVLRIWSRKASVIILIL